MSKATKRKHVTKEVMDDFILPNEKQSIVKVLAGRGNNLHEVEDQDGQVFLVSMPTKFRKNVWIKRGDFVLTEPIEEGGKVKAEIVHILYSDQIKYIEKQGQWPAKFAERTSEPREEKEKNGKEEESNSNSESSDDDDDLFENTNRPQTAYESSEDSDENDDQ
nr:EOG090X0KPP [Sida crystallina]